MNLISTLANVISVLNTFSWTITFINFSGQTFVVYNEIRNKMKICVLWTNEQQVAVLFITFNLASNTEQIGQAEYETETSFIL